MEYALVKIPHENDKKVVVETCHIKNFSTFNVLTQNQVYRYDDGVKKFKCIILHQSDSRDYLLKPKFHNEKEAESGVTNAKEARKNKKQNKITSHSQKTEAIIQVYEENRNSNKEKASNGTSGQDNETRELPINYDEIEVLPNSPIHEGTSEDQSDLNQEPKRKKPKQIIEETDSEKEILSESELEYVEPRVTINNKKDDGENEERVDSQKSQQKPTLSNHIRPKLKDTKILEQNPLMERLMKDNRKKDEENIKLKRQLQQYRLITSSNQLQKQQEQQQKLEQPQKQRYDPYYYIDHDTFHVGDDIYIPSSTSREAFDAPNPSKFIKTMSFAIWGNQTLSQRVVREQKNTNGRTQLTPRKKELLKIHYRQYLESRKYSDEKFNNENSNTQINTYLDRAIQEAKRQTKKQN
ncbi:hypothetical protein KQX54_011810 [Cotesia glomerata]|uniref:Uncharacterized protein n=1 Tax=Cotesia glomerata TaxID=32391 RepID=A0AAV7I8P5_COTGL|nr:hypothetical protein KQX54_011810 [Cotesia glomerata]